MCVTLARTTPPFTPDWKVKINTRLIARVQRYAGARSHTAANLISTYYLALQLRYMDRLRDAIHRDDLDLDREIAEAESRLRQFVSNRQPAKRTGVAAV